MKTLNDVIATLTADQKENSYDLVEILENKLGDYDLTEIQEMTNHDVIEKLDYDGRLHEVIDGAIDIYYYDLRKWAVDNWNYVDDAMDEGLTEGVEDYHKLIQIGQYIYHREICYQELEELIDIIQEAISDFLDS